MDDSIAQAEHVESLGFILHDLSSDSDDEATETLNMTSSSPGSQNTAPHLSRIAADVAVSLKECEHERLCKGPEPY